MSSTPESSRQDASTNDSESSSGFKAFWRKYTKNTEDQNLKFVQQDPGIRKRRNRISRILKPDSTPSSQGDDNEAQTPGQKRRQQVYQAQKRHRNKTAEYTRNLEAEVARLQHLDAVVSSEKNSLAHQNNAIKEFLAKQSIDVYLESVDLDSPNTSIDELSQLGGAAVNIRLDPDLEQERIFLDFPDMSDMVWTSSEGSTDGSATDRPTRHAPVQGDSWAALDFILALEWPCRAHVKHYAINPDTEVPTACAQGYFHGHALTASQAVYQSAVRGPARPKENPPLGSGQVQEGLQPSALESWIVPHSEIDKLVELAELLELDDDYMTPAQAYSAVREYVPSDKFLRPALEALKKPLGSLVTCTGFGACLETPMFYQHLDMTIESLKVNRPDLGR